MSHRAEQVIDAVASRVAVQVGATAQVYTHRRLSLDHEQDELPAISVDYGDDDAVADTTGFIDSVLEVLLTAVVADITESAVRLELLRLRRQGHIAVAADEKQGIPTVIHTTSYGGADAPEIDVQGEKIVGTLTSTWLVHYRMNRLDPGD